MVLRFTHLDYFTEMAKISTTHHEVLPWDKVIQWVSKQCKTITLIRGTRKHKSRMGLHTPGHTTTDQIHTKCNLVYGRSSAATLTKLLANATDGSILVPTYQHQVHQYDNWGPYPHISLQNYYPNLHASGPQHHPDPYWMNPYGQYPPYPAPEKQQKCYMG